MTQTIRFTNEPWSVLDELTATLSPNCVFILVDENTSRLALPTLIAKSKAASSATTITVPAGDSNKGIESATHIWKSLVDNGATRKSMLINLGGGMVTDLGGFAASTFKRGIKFINIPTTLLAAVDAAVGGKTGINFKGLKNEIGVFREADAVIISTSFFKTLPHNEILSGYAEMLKHGLLDGKDAFNELLDFDIESCDPNHLLALLKRSVGVKERIVAEDPTERGLRKALNLGHTPGHAFESWAMERRRPVAHGYAVAWGLIVDLVLSHMKYGFPSSELGKVANFVKQNYGVIDITCNDYDSLLNFMSHDKKNSSTGDINFTLLKEPGMVEIDSIVAHDDIKLALDIFRDLIGI